LARAARRNPRAGSDRAMSTAPDAADNTDADSTDADRTGRAAVLDELVTGRYSCRAYRPEPVPRPVIERMLSIAQRAASWCNTQPWQVTVTEGAGTERFREALYAHAAKSMQEGRGMRDSDLPFPTRYNGVFDR